MPGGEAFVDVLQQKLDESQPDGPVFRPQATYRPAPPLPFLSGPPRFYVGATPYRSTVSPLGAGPTVRLTADTTDAAQRNAANTNHAPGTSKQVTAETRTRRPLTPAERQALEKFIWLGAAVGLDFSATELRSAFRVLALRYHPDRHPGIADVERARLGRIFAELSECHRQLVAVVAPIPH